MEIYADSRKKGDYTKTDLFASRGMKISLPLLNVIFNVMGVMAPLVHTHAVCKAPCVLVTEYFK